MKISKRADKELKSFFNHELDSARDWERFLDALHKMMLDKWYYVACISNTFGGLFNPPRSGRINLKRAKKKVPEELQEILRVKGKTFSQLGEKIKVQQLHVGDRDIWFFNANWREFPKGTSIIEVQQQPKMNRWFGVHEHYRKAYVVLDGAAKPDHQNQAMSLIARLIAKKEFENETLEAKPSAEKGRPVKYQGRSPAELVLRLKENSQAVLRSITMEEKAKLEQYFRSLEAKGELGPTSVKLREEVDRYFLTAKPRSKPMV